MAGAALEVSREHMPNIHFDFVHASRKNDALKAAITKLTTPFVTGTGPPLMSDLHLASNADVAGDGQSLSGYVAVVHGNAPATAELLSGLGTGVSWFRLADSVNEAELARDFSTRPAGSFDMAAVLGRGSSRVSVVAGNDANSADWRKTMYYLVVVGRDEAAAERLAGAAVRQRATVHDVLKGDEQLGKLYVDAVRSSYDRRCDAAQQFAAAHGLRIDTAAPVDNMDTHFLLPTNDSAKQVLAYCNVADPSLAHAGVMMFRGPIAGYTLLTAAEHTVRGQQSFSWDNSTTRRPFGMFPADTGRWLGPASNRVADRHFASTSAVRRVAQNRVRWTGGVKSYNPAAEHAYHAATDADVIAAQAALGAAPGGSVSFTPLDAIVTQIDSLDVKDHALPQLVHVLSVSSEAALPVRLGGPVTQALMRHWPAVRAAIASGESLATVPVKLADVLADESDEHVMLASGVLHALHKVSESQHCHGSDDDDGDGSDSNSQ